jgi:excisionase family DNA binding protein
MTKETAIPEPLLTIEQVATILNVASKTVRRRIATGHLPCVRDGRIVRVRPIDVRTYIAARIQA